MSYLFVKIVFLLDTIWLTTVSFPRKMTTFSKLFWKVHILDRSSQSGCFSEKKTGKTIFWYASLKCLFQISGYDFELCHGVARKTTHTQKIYQWIKNLNFSKLLWIFTITVSLSVRGLLIIVEIWYDDNIQIQFKMMASMFRSGWN